MFLDDVMQSVAEHLTSAMRGAWRPLTSVRRNSSRLMDGGRIRQDCDMAPLETVLTCVTVGDGDAVFSRGPVTMATN